ncbi:MAG: hypothetical protein K8S25_01410 [Alphaproteobacteria bacterium]|nr:hypothetical protein [Alphaproteobacteria bacterium]
MPPVFFAHVPSRRGDPMITGRKLPDALALGEATLQRGPVEHPEVPVPPRDGVVAKEPLDGPSADKRSKRPEVLAPRELVDDVWTMMRDQHVSVPFVDAWAGYTKRGIGKAWRFEDGEFKKTPEGTMARLGRGIGFKEAVPAQTEFIQAPGAGETPEVAAARKAWDEAKRLGDPDAMTRTANALIGEVTKARAQGGGGQSNVGIGRAGSGRDAASEILAPQSADATGGKEKQAGAVGGGGMAGNGAGAYLRDGVDVAKGDLFPEQGKQRVAQPGMSGPGRALPEGAPGDEKTYAVSIPLEAARRAARDISNAPSGRGLAMLAAVQNVFGEVGVQEIAKQLPPATLQSLSNLNQVDGTRSVGAGFQLVGRDTPDDDGHRSPTQGRLSVNSDGRGEAVEYGFVDDVNDWISSWWSDRPNRQSGWSEPEIQQATRRFLTSDEILRQPRMSDAVAHYREQALEMGVDEASVNEPLYYLADAVSKLAQAMMRESRMRPEEARQRAIDLILLTSPSLRKNGWWRDDDTLQEIQSASVDLGDDGLLPNDMGGVRPVSPPDNRPTLRPYDPLERERRLERLVDIFSVIFQDRKVGRFWANKIDNLVAYVDPYTPAKELWQRHVERNMPWDWWEDPFLILDVGGGKLGSKAGSKVLRRIFAAPKMGFHAGELKRSPRKVCGASSCRRL